MRASDAEREQAAEALREHYTAGRLTSEELDERLDAVYKTTTVPELEHLRNGWRLYGPAPELERVERELARHSRRRRHTRGGGPHRGELR
jgi:DUF1707 SHOCT-like domain